MRSWSIAAGRWFGVNFRIHVAFAFLLVFAWVIGAGNLDPRITFPRAIILTVVVGAAVALPELAHLAALGRRGQKPRAVVLLPIGGLWIADLVPEPQPEGEPAKPVAREIRAALAGPAANLALALITAAVARWWAPGISLSQHPWVSVNALTRSAVWINLFLAVLNLLPGYPLDGGRILRALLSPRLGEFRASRRAMAIGNALVLLLMFAGLWDSWLMLAGFFLFLAGQLEERSVVFQSVLQSVRMEEVMLTEFSTLSPADTLEDALNKAVHTLQDDFPVVRSGDMVGVVSRQRILRALRHSGNGYVQSVMERGYRTAARGDSLASAFRSITRQGMTIIPIVEQEKLIGIVTLQNLMHSMNVLAESRKLRRDQPEAGGN